MGQGAGDTAGSFRRVSRSIRRIAGDDAEDFVQEAYTRAISNDVPLEAEPWIRTVAKRLALDKVRRSREYASGAPVELEGLIGDHDGDPQEALVRAERSAEVRKALEELPERYRDALLTYAEESSPGAVATRLGVSANAAWTLLSRARSRLRVQLEQVGYAPVALLTRVKWKGIAIGGAAAGVAAAIAVAPHVPRSTSVTPTLTPAVVRREEHVSQAPSVHHATVPKVSAAVPQLPVAVPSVDRGTLPKKPAIEELVTACIDAPEVPKVAGVDVSDAAHDATTLLAAVTSTLPLPTDDIASKLCK